MHTEQKEKIYGFTRDGTPLSSLGLGLDPGLNICGCVWCMRAGYTTTQKRVAAKVPCQTCNATGSVPRTFPCGPCKGTGKFTQKKSRKVVDCLRCEGTGKFKHPKHTDKCGECHGRKVRNGSKLIPIYHKCNECGGAGEVEIFNPVILKALWGAEKEATA